MEQNGREELLNIILEYPWICDQLLAFVHKLKSENTPQELTVEEDE